MTNYIIHVGPHKTGSTYLQQMFLKHRNEFASHGFEYPEELLTINAHHDIPGHYQGNGSDIPPTVSSTIPWREWGSRQPNVLLSSENFVLLGEDACKRLRRDLEENDATIVFFLRDQRRLWPSHWQEEVKHGAILSFSEYIISILGFRAYFESEKVDPLINLRKFSSVFGRKNIKIVDYDLAIKSGDDIFELFCTNILNIKITRNKHTQSNPNKSFEFYDIEILRGLNECYIRRNSSIPGIQMRQLLLRHIDDVKKSLYYTEIVKFIDSYTEVLSLNSDEAHIKNLETSLMDEFSDRIVNLSDNDQLFGGNTESVKVNTVSRRAYSNTGWWRMLDGIYDTLLELDK